MQTFQSWDTIDGGAGINTLNVQNTGANVLSPTIANIQRLNFQDTSAAGAAVTLNLSGLATLTNMNFDGNGAGSGITVNTLGSLPSIGLSGMGAANAIQFTSGALIGTSNLNLNVDSVLAGASLTLTDIGTQALESVAITTSGGDSNLGTVTFGTVTNGIGTTSVTISGAAGLTMVVADPTATMKTINGATATGNLTLTAIANSTVTGGAGVDTLTSGGGVSSFAGGIGNDVFDFTAGFTNLDTIDGGQGTDQLRVTYAQANAYVQPGTATVTGVESLGLTTAATGAVTTASISSDINTVVFRADANTGANITFPSATATVTVGRTAAGGAGTLTGALTINDTGANTTDALTINAANLNSTTGLGLNALGGQAIAVNGYETVTLNTGVAGAIQTVNTLAITTDGAVNSSLNITGAAGLTTTGSITATNIDASALTGTGALIMGAAATTVTSIVGSTNADTLLGDASSLIEGRAGNDSIVGGTGNDTLRGGEGNDTITANTGNDSIDGGEGNDTVSIAGADVTVDDVINGGAGTNTLQLTALAADITATNAASVSNFQILQTGNAGAGNFNLTLSNFTNNTGFTRADVAGAGAGILTLANTGSALNTLGLLSGSQGDSVVFTRLADTNTDSLTIVNTDGSNLTAGGLGAVTAVTGTVENTITLATDFNNGLTTTTGAMTITTLTAAQATSLVVTGQSAVTVTTATTVALAAINTSGSTGAVTVNAGASQVNLTLTSGSGVQTITSGAGADQLNGGTAADSLSGGAGLDTISGGGGADTIVGGTGADRLTGGAGADKFNQALTDGVAISVAQANGNFAAGNVLTFGNGVDVITDFTAGAGGDVFGVAVAGAAVTGIGVANNTLIAGTNYFLSGTWNATAGTFTVSADGVGQDTLLVQGYAVAGTDIDTNITSVILVGVDSDNLVAGNYAAI